MDAHVNSAGTPDMSGAPGAPDLCSINAKQHRSPRKVRLGVFEKEIIGQQVKLRNNQMQTGSGSLWGFPNRFQMIPTPANENTKGLGTGKVCVWEEFFSTL